MVRQPRGSYVVHPLLSLKVAMLEKKSMKWTLSSICKSASKAVLSRMQVTLHATRPTPHGASRLVQEMFAWSVKTRRAPSRHCSNARVYGHTTTAMHASFTRAPPPLPYAWPQHRNTASTPIALLNRRSLKDDAVMNKAPRASCKMWPVPAN